jgi:hypothetical protein
MRREKHSFDRRMKMIVKLPIQPAFYEIIQGGEKPVLVMLLEQWINMVTGKQLIKTVNVLTGKIELCPTRYLFRVPSTFQTQN